MKKTLVILVLTLFLSVFSIKVNAVNGNVYLVLPANHRIEDILFIDDNNYIAVGTSYDNQANYQGIVVRGNLEGNFEIEYFPEAGSFTKVRMKGDQLLIIGYSFDHTATVSTSKIVIAYGNETSITSVESYNGAYSRILPQDVVLDEHGNFVIVGECDNQRGIWNGFIIIGKFGEKEITYLDIDYELNRGDYLNGIYFQDDTHFIAIGNTDTGNGRKLLLVEGDLSGEYEMNVVGDDGNDYYSLYSAIDTNGELIITGHSFPVGIDPLTSYWTYENGEISIIEDKIDYTVNTMTISNDLNYVLIHKKDDNVHIYKGVVDSRFSCLDAFIDSFYENAAEDEYLAILSVDVKDEYYLVVFDTHEVLYGKFGEDPFIIQDQGYVSATFGKSTSEIMIADLPTYAENEVLGRRIIQITKVTYENVTYIMFAGEEVELTVPLEEELKGFIGWEITDADGTRTILFEEDIEESQNKYLITSDTVIQRVYKKNEINFALWIGLGTVIAISSAFVLNSLKKKKRSQSL